MKLSTAQNDRACGVILGSAVGDALGAGYEFGSAAVDPDGPTMIGGGLGNFAPGEWTDDTSMTWAIAEVAAKGVDLRSPEALDEIAQHFLDWYASHPPDIGTQTRRVLSSTPRDTYPEDPATTFPEDPLTTFPEDPITTFPEDPITTFPEELAKQASRRDTPGTLAADMTQVAARLHARTGHTAGNGSLMRTGPVALAHLGDPTAIVEAAMVISALTHTDPRAGEACALWSLAINHAVLEGELDVRAGLEHLPLEARKFWTERIDEAEAWDHKTFTPNGYVVTALQAAWSAICHTPVPEGLPCLHLQDVLATAIGIGNDTDTVAAIAGGLLGARWGASSVPAAWRRIVHGYPGRTVEELVELAHLAAHTGRANGYGWPGRQYIPYAQADRPVLVQHPFDGGVWLGNVLALDDLPSEITAVVSLCLTGTEQVPSGVEQVVFRLIDEAAPESNPNLQFVLREAAQTVATLRAEGHQVLIHCVAAQSRTPTVGIAYAMLSGVEVDTATKGVCSALPAAAPNHGFRTMLNVMAN